LNLGARAAEQALARAPQPAGDALALNGAVLDGPVLRLPPGAAFILPILTGP
jgi:hypothetical protein